MNVRRAEESDVSEMKSLIEETYSQEAGERAEKEIRMMFTDSVLKPIYLVAVEDEDVVGCAGYAPAFFSYDYYEMFWVTVKPSWQGKGVGTRLVESVVERMQDAAPGEYRILLSTQSPKYFERFGFETLWEDGGTHLMGRGL